MISKELLSAVLGREIGEIVEYGDFSLNIYSVERSFLGQYNIYELAHKIKEWAYDEYDFVISSEYENTIDGKLCRAKCGKKVKFNERVIWIMSACDKAEPEAIFQAGEWILQNIAKGIK